jgi:hypothetical protein
MGEWRARVARKIARLAGLFGRIIHMRRKIARLLGIRLQPKRHDNLLVSFPKSGRTWLRVMLNHAEIPFKPTHAGSSYSQSLHWRDLPSLDEARGIRRTAYLIRDPRDTAVSGYFHYTKRLGRDFADINAFVCDGRLGVEKITRFHLMIYDYLDAGHEGHLCAYEHFHERTVEEFSALASYFLGHPLDEKVARDAVEFASFSNMQKMERTGELADDLGSRMRPADKNDLESFKTRKGKVGGFAEHLNAETIARCNQRLERLDYWARTEKALEKAIQRRGE